MGEPRTCAVTCRHEPRACAVTCRHTTVGDMDSGHPFRPLTLRHRGHTATSRAHRVRAYPDGVKPGLDFFRACDRGGRKRTGEDQSRAAGRDLCVARHGEGNGTREGEHQGHSHATPHMFAKLAGSLIAFGRRKENMDTERGSQ